jgi:uncharacterized protein (DUF697 family)
MENVTENNTNEASQFTDIDSDRATTGESTTDSVAEDLAVKLGTLQQQAAQYLQEKRYEDARRTLKECEGLKAKMAKGQLLIDAKAERERALELINEGNFSEAKLALEHADKLEYKTLGVKERQQRVVNTLRSWIPGRQGQATASATEVEIADQAEFVTSEPVNPVTESMKIVSRHSKIAAVAGLIPGGPLNFVALLGVQIPMIWKIADKFDQKVAREQVRGAVVSLFTAVIPGAIGQGAGMAIASIPAVIAGTVVYFVATPVLAYAMTRAVGNVFIMHFESGGTLLTFDPKAFTEYFISEFRKAGGTISQAETVQPEAAGNPA